jgi:hypothetical protein
MGVEMTDLSSDIRQHVIEGRASREEAEGFIAGLETERDLALAGVEKFSAEAVEANNRLTKQLDAAADLVRTLPRIAGEDSRISRLELAKSAIDRHEQSGGT